MVKLAESKCKVINSSLEIKGFDYSRGDSVTNPVHTTIVIEDVRSWIDSFRTTPVLRYFVDGFQGVVDQWEKQIVKRSLQENRQNKFYDGFRIYSAPTFTSYENTEPFGMMVNVFYSAEVNCRWIRQPVDQVPLLDTVENPKESGDGEKACEFIYHFNSDNTIKRVEGCGQPAEKPSTLPDDNKESEPAAPNYDPNTSALG